MSRVIRIQEEKKTIKCLFLMILLVCFLFSICSVFSSVGAELNMDIVLASQGMIIYPDVVPEVFNQNENLALFSSTVTYNEYGFPMSGVWKLLWTTNIPQYAFIDNSVTRNGPSIRCESSQTGVSREVDTDWLTVVPGDRIVARVWIKTGNSPTYNGDMYHGARIGIDFLGYDESDGWDRVWCPPTSSYGSWITFGTDEWTLQEWDITIPDTWYDVNMNWGEPDYGEPNSIAPKQIGGSIVWLQTMPYQDPAPVWFSDMELYINP